MSKKQFLSTGCTLLNLAISGSPFGGFMKGKYYFLVGDSASGKTFFSMTCFAEAAHNKHFKDYRFIYDDVEDGMLMDVDKLFGVEAGDRIESPKLNEEGEPSYSKTIEQFYYNLDDALAEGKPFVYVLDSMDSLECEDDIKKFIAQKKAYQKGKKTTGTYGMAKAKANSVGLRKVLPGLRESGSILIIISQTRDNPNAGMFASKKTRSGGHALRFYATVEIWTALGGKIKKTVHGIKRDIGNKVKINIKKNRMIGKLHEVWTSIYPSHGVDDIGSCIDYLMKEKWWKGTKAKIKATELGVEGKKSALITYIEQDPKRLRKLRRAVCKCWAEVEDACNLKRPPRYK